MKRIINYKNENLIHNELVLSIHRTNLDEIGEEKGVISSH